MATSIKPSTAKRSTAKPSTAKRSPAKRTRPPALGLPSAVEKVERPEGADLLVPVGQVPVWEAEELIELSQDLESLLDEDGNISLEPGTEEAKTAMRTFLRILKGLSAYAVDEAEWTEFCSGPLVGTLERVGPVVGWYLQDYLGN